VLTSSRGVGKKGVYNVAANIFEERAATAEIGPNIKALLFEN
jgi:hypothetical protein